MGRFTYDRLSWFTLSLEASLKGVQLEALVAWFGTPADQVTKWKAENALVPTWLVVAVDLLEDADLTRFREEDLTYCLARWNIPPRTLARLIGLNPTTVKNWRKPDWHEPHYLSKLLGLMALPGGLYRARRSAGRLISHDRENPDIRYPFKDSGFTALADRRSDAA